MSVEFFQTRMGRQFYEHTMPELVRQLARLNELLEQFTERSEDRKTDLHHNDSLE